MPWESKKVTVKNWRHFTKLVDKVTIDPPATTSYFFRGQADVEWRLRSSLLRRLPEHFLASPNRKDYQDKSRSIETSALQVFEQQAHLHLSEQVVPRNRGDLLPWWSLMQHHGAPTRLLDWTDSPYVAAYFAVMENPNADGVVWCFCASHLQDIITNMAETQGFLTEWRMLKESNNSSDIFWGNKPIPCMISCFEPNIKTERIIAQQGAFTFCTDVLKDHGEVIESAIDGHDGYDSELYKKIIIPCEFKQEFLLKLRAVNITANSLFPGLDGLGRSIKEMVDLRVSGQGSQSNGN